MKRGSRIILDITGYAFEGKGIAKIDREGSEGKKYVVFVNGAYPGDKVEALIRKSKRSFAEGKVEKILHPSEIRTDAKCKYFGVCGGCKQQDMNYEEQVKFKHQQVKDIFERMGGFENLPLEEIIPSEKIFHYRNKMEFSFSDKRWLTPSEIENSENIEDRYFALGLHVPRVYDKVLDINECFLHSESSNKILNLTREFFKDRCTSIFTTRTHEGYLRNLIIKNSFTTSDLMVNIVTSSDDTELMNEYTSKLLNQIPEITTVVNNINLKKSAIAFGDYEKVYHGNGVIFDSIGKYKFRISPNSFFQTNTQQAEKLYNVVMEFAEFAEDEVVYDLYSGAGTISIYISDHVKKVHAFESVEAAVKDAISNSELNGINNIEFHISDLNRSLKEYLASSKIEAPDIIIADPPRGGMNPRTVRDIIRLNPKKLVYVSCNPTTQVRDIKLLNEAGYSLVRVKPVDMFPHTYHIESVALLTKEL
jgi:23S rRNA (uracil1939-C5)-methyltransferase